MILIAGDVHADFDALQAVISHTGAKIILQTGDFGYWPEHSLHRLPLQGFRTLQGELVSVYFCDGNHEDHPALRNLAATGKTEIVPGVHYQPRGSIMKLPDGRSVLFAGGADSIDKKHRIEGKSWFPEEMLTKKEVEYFPETKIDIVISHAAPACVPLPAKLAAEKHTDPTRELLEEVRLRYMPPLWFFSHYHTAFSANIGDTIFICLSRIDAEPDEPCGRGFAELTADGFRPLDLHLATQYAGKIFFPTGEVVSVRYLHDGTIAHVREDEFPEPYKSEYFAGAIGSTMCVTGDGISGVYLHDVQRYLQIRAKGRWKIYGQTSNNSG